MGYFGGSEAKPRDIITGRLDHPIGLRRININDEAYPEKYFPVVFFIGRSSAFGNVL